MRPRWERETVAAIAVGVLAVATLALAAVGVGYIQ